MDGSINSLAERLAKSGEVLLSDAERAVVVDAIAALGAGEHRLALQERLLESYGHDARELLAMADGAMASALARVDASRGEATPDLARHAEAREVLRERAESAGSAAEWIGVVLDFVRVIAG